MIQTLTYNQKSVLINAKAANVNVIRLSESVTCLQRQMMAMSWLVHQMPVDHTTQTMSKGLWDGWGHRRHMAHMALYILLKY